MPVRLERPTTTRTSRSSPSTGPTRRTRSTRRRSASSPARLARDRRRRGHPLRGADRRRRARVLRRHGHEAHDPRVAARSRAASGIDPDELRGRCAASATATLAGFDLGVPLVVRRERPRARRRLRPDARVRAPLRRAPRHLRARGGRARPLPDRQRDACSCRARSAGCTRRSCCSPRGRSTRARARGDRPLNAVVPPDELLADRARRRRRDRRERAARRARDARRRARAAALPLADAYRRQEELGRPLRATDDAREAQRAFVEKRKPQFRGA